MSTIHSEVLAANRSTPPSSARRDLALPPARGFAILTCMDARLDPAKYAGLKEGDAHVIRNAGGRASDDAIRSLVISYKLLGTAEWFVVHHTDCGMEFFTDDVMRGLLSSSLDTAALGPEGFYDVGSGGAPKGPYISWLTIKDQEGTVLEDVKRIRSHPLVPSRSRSTATSTMSLGPAARGPRGDCRRARGVIPGGPVAQPAAGLPVIRPVTCRPSKPSTTGLLANGPVAAGRAGGVAGQAPRSGGRAAGALSGRGARTTTAVPACRPRAKATAAWIHSRAIG